MVRWIKKKLSIESPSEFFRALGDLIFGKTTLEEIKQKFPNYYNAFFGEREE